MKNLKKVAALLLVLALGLTLCACGGKSDVIGTWQGELDASEYVIAGADEEMRNVASSLGLTSELPSIGDYMGSYCVKYRFVFNEDGTYAMNMDEGSFQETIESYKLALTDYCRDVFFIALTDTLVQMGAAGEISSVEDLESLLGVSLDELINEALGMELSDYVSQIFDEEFETLFPKELMNAEGKYKTKDGKLYLSAGLEYNVDPEMYDLYTIEGTTMTIEAGPAAVESDSVWVYPMVLEKAA